MRKYLTRGFTLVELLIVIGLLGAIALIVIAAINPIEQANRARDARFKADGGQLISAIERYYAAHSAFPWEGCAAVGCTTASDDEFAFLMAGSEAVGLCGSSCSVPGLLIDNDELKTEFLGRDWATAITADKQIMIGKAGTSASSVYACFIPLSKSERDKAAKAVPSKVRSLTFEANGTISINGACTTGAGTNWVDDACYVCIPE